MGVSVSKADQSQATRRVLLRVSRDLFARHGYEGTSIQQVTRRARITRGALYHHFASKRDLFRAVFEQVDADLAQHLAQAGLAEERPERRLETGAEAFFDACLDPAVQRIILLDGPSVLGWEEWHDIDVKHGLGLLRAVVSLAMEEGHLERQPVEPVAQLLLGALNEAGITIARSSDVARTRREIGTAFSRLVAGLRAP